MSQHSKVTRPNIVPCFNVILDKVLLYYPFQIINALQVTINVFYLERPSNLDVGNSFSLWVIHLTVETWSEFNQKMNEYDI